MSIIKNFDQLTKKQFDQMPKLLENFDQLKMPSEIRSSDRFPVKLAKFTIFLYYSAYSHSHEYQILPNFPNSHLCKCQFSFSMLATHTRKLSTLSQFILDKRTN